MPLFKNTVLLQDRVHFETCPTSSILTGAQPTDIFYHATVRLGDIFYHATVRLVDIFYHATVKLGDIFYHATVR